MAHNEETKTYVEYLYPGILFSETDTKVVKSRNPQKVFKKLPPAVFAFRFFDQTSKEVLVDKEYQEIRGKRKNESGMYYPYGTTYNLDQIKAMGKDHSILASNMECNNWPIVVKTRVGNFQPFETGDVILTQEQDLIQEREV